jgi:hypothetical protein
MTSIQQMTLRLPEDLARRLAAATPSRKRNQFVVDLVRRELERESRELQEAAIRLSSLEAAHASEDSEWLVFDNKPVGDDEFDEKRFLSEFKARKEKASKSSRVSTAT